MPWALLTRWLVRLLASMVVWRVATARRGARAGAPPLRHRAPGQLGPRPTAAALREGASIGWRLVTALALLVVAGVLISAGVTLTVLNPRWLGILLLVLAAITVVAMAADIRVLVRLLLARRLRRHEHDLRRQLS